MGTQSVFARRQLGRHMERQRLLAGLTQQKVGDAVGVASRATISAIEGGKRAVQVNTIIGLLVHYGVHPGTETFDVITALARASVSDSEWWEEGRAAGWPDWLQMYLGLEASALDLRVYEHGLVHGLLQTEAYARAIISTDLTISPDVVAQRATSRLARRRAVLERPEPARLDVVLREPAIRMPVGGPDVMAEQLTLLGELAMMPTVSISIIPTEAAPLVVPGSSFALLRFAGDDDPPVAYTDDYTSARTTSETEIVAVYDELWLGFAASAIPWKEFMS